MALNITSEQLVVAQNIAATGDYVAGWNYLASAGDRYADNAGPVASGEGVGIDKVMAILVENHWENVSGSSDAYEQKFDQVARQHFKQYVKDIKSNDNRLPDSKQK